MDEKLGKIGGVELGVITELLPVAEGSLVDPPGLIERDIFFNVSAVIDNSESPGRKLFLDMFEGTSFAAECEEGEPLGSVIDFFAGMVDEMGLQDSLFFKNEKVKADFIERFEIFDGIFTSEIAGLERKLKIYEYSNFPEGWQDRLKKAAYYAFFVHYGSKRKVENDDNGMPKDYVIHVARSTFNCLIRKMQFFDEETVLATMLHDTREDWSKSFISILHMSERGGFSDEDLEKAISGGVKGTELHKRMLKAEKVSQVFEYMKCMEASLNPPGDESDISELIEMVTKKYSDRNRTLLDFLHNLSNIDYHDSRFYSEWKALMVKMADRLDNARTVIVDPEKNLSKKSQQIYDETALIFKVLAENNGMVNVEDWYIDYLVEQHLVERGVIRGFDRAVEKQTGMKDRFRQDFDRKLKLIFSEASIGDNYWIEFRPVGIRYLNFEDSVLSEDEYHVYAQKLRSYMMFFPLKNCPYGLIEAAKEVFYGIFSERKEMPNRVYVENSLEDEISNRIDEGKGACGLDEHTGYGCGVWTVFDSQREAVECFLGDFHLAYFYKDKEAAKSVMERFIGISGKIEQLENFYDFVVLDLLERVEKEPKLQGSLDFIMGEFSNWVKSVFGLRVRGAQ